MTKTSRASLDHLLDPDNDSATVESLRRAGRRAGVASGAGLDREMKKANGREQRRSGERLRWIYAHEITPAEYNEMPELPTEDSRAAPPW